MTVTSYRDLQVWQRAMDMVVACYSLARKFPGEERYGLISQLQRAAVSVPANIAEGRGRRTTRDFLRHLSIACGSLAELETHIEIAVRLKYVAANDVQTTLADTATIGRMLTRLQQSLRRRVDDPAAPQSPSPNP